MVPLESWHDRLFSLKRGSAGATQPLPEPGNGPGALRGRGVSTRAKEAPVHDGRAAPPRCSGCRASLAHRVGVRRRARVGDRDRRGRGLSAATTGSRPGCTTVVRRASSDVGAGPARRRASGDAGVGEADVALPGAGLPGLDLDRDQRAHPPPGGMDRAGPPEGMRAGRRGRPGGAGRRRVRRRLGHGDGRGPGPLRSPGSRRRRGPQSATTTRSETRPRARWICDAEVGEIPYTRSPAARPQARHRPGDRAPAVASERPDPYFACGFCSWLLLARVSTTGES